MGQRRRSRQSSAWEIELLGAQNAQKRKNHQLCRIHQEQNRTSRLPAAENSEENVCGCENTHANEWNNNRRPDRFLVLEYYDRGSDRYQTKPNPSPSGRPESKSDYANSGCEQRAAEINAGHKAKRQVRHAPDNSERACGMQSAPTEMQRKLGVPNLLKQRRVANPENDPDRESAGRAYGEYLGE